MTKFTHQEAIEAARSAGFDVTGLEQQAAERDAGGGDLREKVANVGAKLQRPEPPATPEDQEQAFAADLLEHLNASRTPYYSARA